MGAGAGLQANKRMLYYGLMGLEMHAVAAHLLQEDAPCLQVIRQAIYFNSCTHLLFENGECETRPTPLFSFEQLDAKRSYGKKI